MINNLNAQEINFYPLKKDNVKNSDYRMGIRILEETQEAIANDSLGANYQDYWNIAHAYKLLGQETKIVLKYLNKSKQSDQVGFSFLFAHDEVKYINWEDYMTLHEFNRMKIESEKVMQTIKQKNQKTTEKKELDKYSNASDLFKLINRIGINDQKYRKINNVDLESQKKYDLQNIAIIDSLYKQYNRYIGKSLVGEDKAYVMWSVIQHSDLKHMQKYLPVIRNAVQEGEIAPVPLKMLIDRIYTTKYGFQIFGSQLGIPLAPENLIKTVRKENGF